MRGRMRPVSYGATSQDPWIGIAARIVDDSNYPYLTLRRSNQLSLRRLVNGSIQVIATTSPVNPDSLRHPVSAGLDDPAHEEQRDQWHGRDHEMRAQEDARITLAGRGDGSDRKHATGRDYAADVVAEARTGGAQAGREQLG